MKCVACSCESKTARFCKACLAFGCNLCQPDCTLRHRHCHVRLVTIHPSIRKRRRASSAEDGNSSDASSGEEQPEREIFDETH